jgi:hypothetical protein
MYSADSGRTVAVLMGPTFGGPIRRLAAFRAATGGGGAALAYATASRVVGLLAWPMDGDPGRMMGLVAHAGVVHAMAVSSDGRKLLTAGGLPTKQLKP